MHVKITFSRKSQKCYDKVKMKLKKNSFMIFFLIVFKLIVMITDGFLNFQKFFVS